MLAGSLLSGLVGAYGRERHEGRSPDGSWWLTRACAMPVLAIISYWLIDQFHLSNPQGALATAILSMMGYEAIAIVLDRAKKRGSQIADAAIGGVQATPRPYVSVVDTDDAGRPTAHVEIVEVDKPAQNGVGAALRSSLKGAVAEPLPDDMTDLVNRLGDPEL